MEFHEKLSFLLQITNISNNELANALGVGPSIISLYKTGRRDIPKRSIKVRKLASFFGTQILNKYQRQALAEKMENNDILQHFTPTDISEAIFCWFSNKAMPTNGATQRMLTALEMENLEENNNATIVPQQQSTRIYTGQNGKVEATQNFLSHVLTVDSPTNLYLHEDDNRDWYYSDPTLFINTRHTLDQVIKRGGKIIQILPPTNGEFLVDMFSNCLPLYLTGKMVPYYYPRYRDTIFRGFQIALEDEIAVMSYGVLNGKSQGFAALLKEKHLVKDVADTLKDYLAHCRPALTIHNDPKGIFEGFLRFVKEQTPQICLRPTLPLESLPKQDLDRQVRQHPSIAVAKYLPKLQLDIDNIYNEITVDICGLANAKQVRAGKVRMPISDLPLDKCPTYTPSSYCRHLNKIIETMENHDNYFFVPLPYYQFNDELLFVRKDRQAMMIHNDPYIIYEITAPELVKALEEYVVRKADNVSFTAEDKQMVIKKLRELINELQS